MSGEIRGCISSASDYLGRLVVPGWINCVLTSDLSQQQHAYMVYLPGRTCDKQGLSRYLETGCPNRGFIDFCVSEVWYKIHTTNKIDPIRLQILLF